MKDSSPLLLFNRLHAAIMLTAVLRQDGDPYRDEMEQCVGMIMQRLQQRGVHNSYSLAYQSRVGPVCQPFVFCMSILYNGGSLSFLNRRPCYQVAANLYMLLFMAIWKMRQIFSMK